MLSLQDSLKGMFEAEDNLRTKRAKEQPTYLSEQFYRLGQYTAAVENHLGELEQWYEESEAEIMRDAMRTRGMNPTAAKAEVKMELGDKEGEIKYLSRICKAAWQVHTGAMARVKHLENEMKGNV